MIHRAITYHCERQPIAASLMIAYDCEHRRVVGLSTTRRPMSPPTRHTDLKSVPRSEPLSLPNPQPQPSLVYQYTSLSLTSALIL